MVNRCVLVEKTHSFHSVNLRINTCQLKIISKNSFKLSCLFSNHSWKVSFAFSGKLKHSQKWKKKINMEKFKEDTLYQILTFVKDSIVFVDHGAAECLHWSNGLSKLLNAGALDVRDIYHTKVWSSCSSGVYSAACFYLITRNYLALSP